MSHISWAAGSQAGAEQWLFHFVGLAYSEVTCAKPWEGLVIIVIGSMETSVLGLTLQILAWILMSCAGVQGSKVRLHGAGDELSRSHHLVWTAGYKASRREFVHLDTEYRSVVIPQEASEWEDALRSGKEFLGLDFLQDEGLDLVNTSGVQLVPVAAR